MTASPFHADFTYPGNPRLSKLVQGEAVKLIISVLSHDISMFVPASLRCITSFVLLEQEHWFEREVGFVLRWLKQGMHAIDVGANLGVYSLPMALVVGKTGRVIAFEPGGGNRKHLEASRLANDLEQLAISACALADAEKQGWLEIAESGELNALSEGAARSASSERVRVSTLDIQEQEYRWPSIDFIKIDAEGQEDRIVAGGRDFFGRHSPLVMYEFKHGDIGNNALRRIFEALGYTTYRLLGDATCLVPVASDELFDPFELNLFAAKPDRANDLARQGLLVGERVPFALTDLEREQALDCALALPFARWFELSREDFLDCAYGDALAVYAACNFLGLSAARRFSGLEFAFAILSDYCRDSPTPTGLATLARVALDLGFRTLAVQALNQLVSLSAMEIDQPFFPPCARFDRISPEGREADWFVAASNEQFELSRAYSSFFASADFTRLKWLCDSPFASAELGRRRVLAAAREGIEAGDLLADYSPALSTNNPSFWTNVGVRAMLSLAGRTEPRD